MISIKSSKYLSFIILILTKKKIKHSIIKVYPFLVECLVLVVEEILIQLLNWQVYLICQWAAFEGSELVGNYMRIYLFEEPTFY